MLPCRKPIVIIFGFLSTLTPLGLLLVPSDNAYGYSAVMWLSVGLMLVRGLIAFNFYETAPAVLAKRQAAGAK